MDRGYEPINLREWKLFSTHQGRVFTCGRPGRGTPGYCRERKRVDDETINRWVEGLPDAAVLHVVSLLGRKKPKGLEKIGFSEFGYYPFRSVYEADTKPTLQEWLDERYVRRIVVHEFPTVDAQGIPPADLDRIMSCVLGLLGTGVAVVIVDSAGAERTSRVCERMGLSH